MYFCIVLCTVCFVSFSVLFVCICVQYYCHRVATQLQLTNIYHIISYIKGNANIPCEVHVTYSSMGLQTALGTDAEKKLKYI